MAAYKSSKSFSEIEREAIEKSFQNKKYSVTLKRLRQ